MLEWSTARRGHGRADRETEAFLRSVLPPPVTAGGRTDLSRFEQLRSPRPSRAMRARTSSAPQAMRQPSPPRQERGLGRARAGRTVLPALAGARRAPTRPGASDFPHPLAGGSRQRWPGATRPTRVWPNGSSCSFAASSLANAFVELTDPAEQRRRFEADRARRHALHGPRLAHGRGFPRRARAVECPIPPELRFGFDRLAMIAAGADRIDQVLWLPFSERD